ncbi:hypothetical protein BJ508DRAFT_9172 [Ascobolus immersus RN42]|uniref:Uncharacterized protein n=1 Tax=Ascobolus immersus RN42 TaxID=1160509 RepID=A0A3N4HX40_ASCIM|nr:hypothetical protein BJ508DRAFT_9172 [Ascobolus immersus RN42]
MPSKFSRWTNRLAEKLHRRRDRDNGNSSSSQPPPVLPPNPYLLSPSRTSLSEDYPPNSFSDATSDSLFFTRLPSDVRHLIYSYIFPKQRIHLDLSYDHPFSRDPRPQNLSHARLRTRPSGLGSPIRDITIPKRWHWVTSVCHDDGFTQTVREDGVFYEPSLRYDSCLMGECQQHFTVARKRGDFIGNNTTDGLRVACDEAWRLWRKSRLGPEPEGTSRPVKEISPGVMAVVPDWVGMPCVDGRYMGSVSWLLTCKQAYSETIDLLYTKTLSLDTIGVNREEYRTHGPHSWLCMESHEKRALQRTHSPGGDDINRSVDLTTLLPSIFPRQRLDCIAGLSMNWVINKAFDNDNCWADFANLFGTTLRSFTRLRTLQMQIHYLYQNTSFFIMRSRCVELADQEEEVEKRLCHPIDSYITSASAVNLRGRCRILIGRSLFDPLKTLALSRSNEAFQLRAMEDNCLRGIFGPEDYRFLNQTEAREQLYRQPEEATDANGSTRGCKRNYWISSGNLKYDTGFLKRQIPMCTYPRPYNHSRRRW